MSTPNVTVAGLGSMGMGMAINCVRNALPTRGQDVDLARMQEFEDAGGQPADSEAPQDIVVLVVVNNAQMSSVLFADGGLIHRMSPGALVIGCTTQGPEDAKNLASRLAEHDIEYLDAPISGGAARAASGDLVVMASGSDRAFQLAKPVLEAVSATVYPLGTDVGSASAMKMVNQLLAGIHIASTAEAFSFGIKHGISADRLFEVIRECAGSSWMFENRGPHIVEGDYTPLSSVDIFVKDLGIVSDMARGSHCYTPLAAAALQEFIAASASGLGKEDDSAVAKIFARNNGITLPGED